MTTLADLRTLVDGSCELCHIVRETGSLEAILVMRRVGGGLLAAPQGGFLPAELETGQSDELPPEALVGPSTALEVPLAGPRGGLSRARTTVSLYTRRASL